MNEVEVKKEWELKLRQSFQNADALMGFIIHTLESFAYRYGLPQQDNQGPVIVLHGHEENMGQAMKTSHAAIKEGVKQLAKSVPREQKPALVSRLKIEIHELSADEGKITLTSQVSWGHPEHSWSGTDKCEKKKVLSWNDLHDFRKGFPLALEEVCDLFV